MKITRTASVAWQGGIRDGQGAITTESHALDGYPYGFGSRFEGKAGSNPEELVAAAHAGCFTMALSLRLGQARLAPEKIETRCAVTLEQLADGYAITASQLTVRAAVPGADAATFLRIAREAEAGCPVSKLLKAEISLDAALLV